MAYCPYCGRQLTADMAFCPGCGAPLAPYRRISTSPITEAERKAAGDYRIYITGLGSACRSCVIDLLEDALGYNTYTATLLVNNIPVQIAGNLFLQQAAVIAQLFEEYGVLVSVTSNDTPADISMQTSAISLYQDDGSFLPSAALTLVTITAANRLRMITKPKSPSIPEFMFHSLFQSRSKPPVHIRRNIHQSFGPLIRTLPQPPKLPLQQPRHMPRRQDRPCPPGGRRRRRPRR